MAATICFFEPFQLSPFPSSSLLNSLPPSSNISFLPLTKSFPKPVYPYLLHKFYNINPTKRSPTSLTLALPSSSDSDLCDRPNFADPPPLPNLPVDVLQLKRTGGFLGEEELKKLQILENFRYSHEFDHGLLQVRVMGLEEIDRTVELLADSFADLMWGPFVYTPILRVLVRQHLLERRVVLPHAATLLGFYSRGEGESELAGTVEISFDSRGSNAAPPTPIPPRSAPYLCNMSVKKELRRMGIGWHLLKACEELIPQFATNEVYLHCRIIDTPALKMYKKAGFGITKTDSMLTLLSFQRRKHLMYKKLPFNTENPCKDPSIST